MVPGAGPGEVAVWAPSPWFLLTPPQRAGDAIDRPRLVGLLDAVVPHRRVTLVTAPAGFGKTTTLAEWVRSAPDPVAWLSLTRFDEHPARLLRGVVSALVRLADGDPRFAPLRGAAADRFDLATAYGSIAAAVEAVGAPVVLVVDDVHLLGPAAADGILALLVERAPAALHLVLAGRHAPALPLERVRLAGELAEIAVAELSFTADEIERVTRAAGRPSGPAASAELHARTGGWPAAVRLAVVDAHRRAGDAPPGLRSDAHLADYVVGEILADLPAHLRRFVLDVTTCDLLDRRLAAALTGDDDSAVRLEECRGLGLFLDRFTTEADEPVYRWHPVFAEQCRTILVGDDPERADRLDRAAARALAARYPLQALVHARRGRDPDLAVQIITDHWLELVLRSDAPALEQQCLALPADRAESPLVLLVRACCRNLADDRTTAHDLLARADAAGGERHGVARGLAAVLLADGNVELQGACDRVARLLREPRGWTPAEYAAATFLLGWTEVRLRRDPPRALRLLQAAQQACADTGQDVVARRAAVNGAFALAYLGRFTAACRKIAEVLPPGAGLDGCTSVEDAIEWVTEGWVAYWQDDLELALRRLRVPAVRRDPPGTPSALARGYFGYAAVADGRPALLDEAEHLLTEASRGERRGVPWHIYPLLGLAMVATARGRPRRARALLDTIPDYPHTHVVGVQIAEAYRQVGDPQEALARLDRVARREPGTRLPYVVASSSVTRGLIHLAEGDRRAAHACLARALDAALPESVRRPFVGTDPLLRDLLTEHAARGTPHTAFVADCLARARWPSRAVPAPASRSPAASGRSSATCAPR